MNHSRKNPEEKYVLAHFSDNLVGIHLAAIKDHSDFRSNDEVAQHHNQLNLEHR